VLQSLVGFLDTYLGHNLSGDSAAFPGAHLRDVEDKHSVEGSAGVIALFDSYEIAVRQKPRASIMESSPVSIVDPTLNFDDRVRLTSQAWPE
jgi:hypothetical protein